MLGGFTPFWKHIEIEDYKGIHATGAVSLRRSHRLDFVEGKCEGYDFVQC